MEWPYTSTMALPWIQTHVILRSNDTTSQPSHLILALGTWISSLLSPSLPEISIFTVSCRNYWLSHWCYHFDWVVVCFSIAVIRCREQSSLQKAGFVWDYASRRIRGKSHGSRQAWWEKELTTHSVKHKRQSCTVHWEGCVTLKPQSPVPLTYFLQ